MGPGAKLQERACAGWIAKAFHFAIWSIRPTSGINFLLDFLLSMPIMRSHQVPFGGSAFARTIR